MRDSPRQADRVEALGHGRDRSEAPHDLHDLNTVREHRLSG